MHVVFVRDGLDAVLALGTEQDLVGDRAAERRREESGPATDRTKVILAYIPALLKASVITILLSCLAMALAIALGVLIASGRVYGNTLVRGPQAFRFALPPMTNDFVALLKDSSLVSVITVIELTKQTQIFATNLGSWVIPGTLCAALYLAMSLPLAALARRMERQWRVTPS